jgi:hypothetical protein
MIIIGYQGIGKSTFCKTYGRFLRYLELESGLMKDPMNGNKRWENWAEIYCNIALSLSSQDYMVFISSHKAVQDILAYSKNEVIAIYPSKAIKDEWIQKLLERYKKTGLKKDEIAWLDAKANYDSEIDILERSPFTKATIYSMDYDLKNVIEHAVYDVVTNRNSHLKEE